MYVSGLTGSPSNCCLRIPTNGRARVSALGNAWKTAEGISFLLLERRCWSGFVQKCCRKQTPLVKCAMDASFGDLTNGQYGNHMGGVHQRFCFLTQIHVRDPYKRLGISKEASEDEIQGARNFLIQKYAGHKPSVDAIESAHDKIIMQQFYERKNPKIDIKKKVREVKQSRFVQTVTSRFQTPPTMVIVKTSIAFLVLGALTVLFPTEEGPTLQVAISLMGTIYFIHDRLKSKIRAFLYGAGAFILSWLLGTFLMVSIIPPIPFVKGLRSFEATSALITYVLLWVSSAYLQ